MLSAYEEDLLFELLGSELLKEVCGHFNQQYYLDNNEDVRSSGTDPFLHYLTLGWTEGRESIPASQIQSYIPNPGYTRKDGCLLFSMLKNNLDQHFARTMEIPVSAYQALVKHLSLDFDFSFYSEQIDFRLPPNIAIDHYFLRGRKRGLTPCAGTQGEFISNKINKTLYLIQQSAMPKAGISEKSKSFLEPLVPATIPIGCCDMLLVGGNHGMAIGWAVHDGELVQASLHNPLNAFEVTDYQIIRCARDDVLAVHPDYANSQMSGFIIIFDLMGFFLTDYGAKTSLKLAFDNQQNLDIEINKQRQAKPGDLEAVLRYWDYQDASHTASVVSIFHPILLEIFKVKMPCDANVHEFGVQADNPTVSVVIPLYGRSDFLQYQVSNFARYRSVSCAEIIYVIDDPRIEKQALQQAVWAHSVFDVPFKVLLLERNVGFGRANNIAVTYCNAEKILLLNSDILPKDSKWLNQLLAHADNIENMGALGARLLFEDESIQHDGMESIHRPDFPGLTLNNHPCKGWPVDMSPNPPKLAKCNLVTAACLLIDKQLFLDVGGFEPHYFMGDFEDSDLCRKLLAKGYENYIARDVVLNHLERQSQSLVKPGDWKQKLTLMNAVYYQHRLDTEFLSASPAA